MKKLNHLSIGLMGLLLSACYTAPTITPSENLQGNYILDPAHTSIVWKIKHAGLSNYTARFDTVSGVLNFDPQNPQDSRIDISIDPMSVNTGDTAFNETIGRGGRYFNGEQHPSIRFVSTDIKVTGENTGLITGALSFRGQTHPVTLDTVFNGAGKSFGHKGKTLGFSATTHFKRTDFGLSHLINFGIGDEITIIIETEFNEK